MYGFRTNFKKYGFLFSHFFKDISTARIMSRCISVSIIRIMFIVFHYFYKHKQILLMAVSAGLWKGSCILAGLGAIFWVYFRYTFRYTSAAATTSEGKAVRCTCFGQMFDYFNNGSQMKYFSCASRAKRT